MSRLVLLLVFILLQISILPTLFAQNGPAIQWDKTFGGASNDDLNSLSQTSDGGYILGGISQSGISGDKSQASKGSNDYWVVKLNPAGNKVWDKTFGGNQWDYLNTVTQTSDSGYILGGWSSSGISGDKSQASKGAEDYWIVKLDSLGNKLWDKTIGGFGTEYFYSLAQTSDGGYIIGGHSRSGISGDKSQANKGSSGTYDYWVVKLDASGNKQWDKTIGGNNEDFLYSVVQTPDGGYMLGGHSQSGISGDKTEPSKGGYDYWVVKLDASGNKLWDKTIGGSSSDHLTSLAKTLSGGFILGGYSDSPISGDKTQANVLGHDYWVVKLDASGNKLWDTTVGGNNMDAFTCLAQAQDGGFLIGGYSQSGLGGDKTQPNRGSSFTGDFWIVKLNSTGNKVWDKTVGSSGYDGLFSLIQTLDGSYVLGGYSDFGTSGDKTATSKGNRDYWIVKLNSECAGLAATLSTSCNSNGTIDVIANVNLPISIGSSSWNLNYNVNGSPLVFTSNQSSVVIAQNAPIGTNFSLVSVSAGSCSINLTNSLTVQAVPTAPIVSSGNNCGPGQVILTAASSPNGGTYNLYSTQTGGIPLTTSTSSTILTPNISSTTTYYIGLMNSGGCESPRTQVMATITNLSATPGSAQTICENAAPVQLTGYAPAGGTFSGPGVSATGLFTPASSLIGSQTITYTVTQNGCTASATQSITVVAAPVVSAGVNDTVCASAVPFQVTGASPSGGTWTGSGVSATGLFTPTHALAGTQNLTYSFAQNGCTVTATKAVVIPTPPAQPVISLHSSDTLIASTPGSSYEWKRNNNVVAGNKQILKVTTSGTYSVRVKDADNCASLFSADYTYTVSGLKEELQNSFSHYPNPTSGILTLEMQTAQPAEVVVLNALGQQVLQKTLSKTDEKVQLDLSSAAKGIYLVQVKTDKQIAEKKIVVE